jgi:hypothetical protein
LRGEGRGERNAGYFTMCSMFSKRFNREIILTRHAQARMTEREIDEAALLDVINFGETRYSDAAHLWVYKALPSRSDNLLCAVLVLEESVVKTVMHLLRLSRRDYAYHLF